LVVIVKIASIKVILQFPLKNMMNCLWQSRLTENKTPSSLIRSSFFQARCRREQLAKHNAMDDARPRANAAYHCMND
jgi:hypothetical protein